MVKAAALLYTTIVAFIIAVLMGALVLYSYYTRIEHVNVLAVEQVTRNAQSGINLLLSRQILVNLGEEKRVDLYEAGEDSVFLKKMSWGAFEVAVARATMKQWTCSQAALVGTFSLNRKALYLADLDRPLSLCGKTNITGDCFLPAAGVKRAYIGGRSFEGDKLINGTVTNSQKMLPPVNKKLLAQLNSLFLSNLKNDSVLAYVSSDSIINSFHQRTLKLYSADVIFVGNQLVKGNVILVSAKAIVVSAAARIKDVILVAPQIRIEAGFRGTLQAFATDSIRVSKNTTLDYPSVLGIINKEESFSGNSSIVIEENVAVCGVVLGCTIDYGNGINISLAKNSIVKGLLYVDGALQLNGEVDGSVYCKNILLVSPSGVYENHLMDATIDATKLSTHFTSVSLIEDNDNKQVAKWLY